MNVFMFCSVLLVLVNTMVSTALALAALMCVPGSAASDSIFNYSAVMIDGTGPVSLAKYRGNVTIVVNVAT